MKLRNILIAAFVLLGRGAMCQDIGLNIGDRLPDVSVPKTINWPRGEMRTGDFSDRLLIIDFWATNCAGCVAALPKMDSLQKQFGDRVMVLPVTYEPSERVAAFWKGNSYTRKLELPSVVEDKLFASYFRHVGVPHEVWVYKGKVVAITDADYVDAKNIKKVLDGERIDWPVKNDFYRFDASSEPLFAVDTNQADPASVRKYAAISGYREKVSSSGLLAGAGIVRNRATGTVRAYIVNAAILNAYQWCLSKSDGAAPRTPSGMRNAQHNEIAWEVSDRSRYRFDPRAAYQQQWMRDNAICYESLNPDTGQSDLEVRKAMVSDLNRLLGLKVGWEKRKEKVLLLVGSGEGKPVRAAAGTTSLGNLVYRMNQREGGPYVFDETGYSEMDAIPEKAIGYTDIGKLRMALRPYGLALKEEERLVDRLVFAEVDERLVINGPMATAARARRDAQAEMKQPDSVAGRRFLEENGKRPGVVTLPSGLQYRVIRPGNGIMPRPDDRVRVNYTGMLANGKIFESSLETGRPAEFSLQNVIEGWRQALPLMAEGSKWEIYVPAQLAYGERTNGGSIPPNSMLVFELELVKVVK